MGAFKSMMAGVSGAASWELMRMWTVLLLQRPDGSWKISPSVANALRAGEPIFELTHFEPEYDAEPIWSSIPTQLLQACITVGQEGGPPTLHPYRLTPAPALPLSSLAEVVVLTKACARLRSELAARIWVTLLVLDMKNTLPWDVITNPADEPTKSVLHV